MDPKLLEAVVENVVKKFLVDEDEAMLVAKLMLKVLREETTVDEATRGRSISAGKLSEYVEATRFTLNRFDASVDEAISQVRRSSTGRVQLPTADSDDEITIIKQEAVDNAEPVQLVSAVHAPLAPVPEENISQPPKKKACKPANQRRTSDNAARVPDNEKMNEPKHRIKCTFGTCTKTYSRSDVLKRHVDAYHLKLKPYQCGICDKLFSTASNRNCHEQTHQKDRDHECHACLSTFSTKAQLNKHSLTHMAVEAQKCPRCGQAFRRGEDIKRHITMRCPNGRKFRPY